MSQFCDVYFFFIKGYNEELDKLEKKLEATAKQKFAESKMEASPEKKIRMSDVVAVFVLDWHKYVRASVKKKERDDLYCVWAIDYGVPMIAHASNIVLLPSSFNGMQFKNGTRIHLGGMEHCLPAEKQFNMAKESSDKQKLMNWSPQAIELVQNILNQAVKLEFEHVQNLMPIKRSHYFGRLMMQRPSDGQMMNVVKSLLEMNMAVLAEQEFKAELTSIESLNQRIMFSVNNELLDVQMLVLPVKTVSDDTGYSNSDFFESEDESESLIGEDGGGELTIEDNEFFDDSASVMQPRLRNESNVDTDLASIPESQKEIHVDRSNSNASQEESKSIISKRKSNNDAQNNNTSPKVDNEKQQPKNTKKQHDRRKQKNKDHVSNRNDNQSQQQQPQQQQPKQQPQQQQNHQQQQYHRQSMSLDQSGGHQRGNGEQKPNHSNFQHSHHSKSFTHPAVQQHHFRLPGYRNFRDAKYNGCAEFEASLGKPPPTAMFGPPPPFLNAFPPPLIGRPPVPPQYPMNFRNMYGPSSHQPRQTHPPRQSTQFHDDSTKQTMNLMSMLNIKPPIQSPQNHGNQRAQSRLRNRNSGFQRRFNQSAANGEKTNANGNIEQCDTDGNKAIVKKSPSPSKVDSVKPEKSQLTSENI